MYVLKGFFRSHIKLIRRVIQAGLGQPRLQYCIVTQLQRIDRRENACQRSEGYRRHLLRRPIRLGLWYWFNSKYFDSDTVVERFECQTAGQIKY